MKNVKKHILRMIALLFVATKAPAEEKNTEQEELSKETVIREEGYEKEPTEEADADVNDRDVQEENSDEEENEDLVFAKKVIEVVKERPLMAVAVGTAASDEMDAVVPLGLDVEILVFLAEQSEVHIEAVYLGLRELFLDLYGLLDCSYAAYLRTLRVAGLFVSGAYTMYETYGIHLGIVNSFIISCIEPILQIAIGNHLIVNTISVFFFFLSFEKLESGRKENIFGYDRYSV